MNILIYYFSGTGNTWWVGNQIKEKLEREGCKVGLYSIEDLSEEDIKIQMEESDHLVIGFPVYGSTASPFMISFLDRLPKTEDKKPISVYATQAAISGDSSYYVGTYMEKKGYRLKNTIHFKMMNNFHLPKFKSLKPDNGKKLDDLLEKTVGKVEVFAGDILSENEKIRGNNFIGHKLGDFQRKNIQASIKNISSDFEIDMDKCIKCKKCERICPVENIGIDDMDKFKDRCILCLRCYSQCPVSAILVGEGSCDTKKYPRYKGPGKNFKVEYLIKNDK